MVEYSDEHFSGSLSFLHILFVRWLRFYLTQRSFNSLEEWNKLFHLPSLIIFHLSHSVLFAIMRILEHYSLIFEFLSYAAFWILCYAISYSLSESKLFAQNTALFRLLSYYPGILWSHCLHLKRTLSLHFGIAVCRVPCYCSTNFLTCQAALCRFCLHKNWYT